MYFYWCGGHFGVKDHHYFLEKSLKVNNLKTISEIMKKAVYKCSFISPTSDQWPETISCNWIHSSPDQQSSVQSAININLCFNLKNVCCWKNLNSNQFVEVLSHLSFVITTCSHLCIRDFIGKYVRGGRATIPATATSKRFNRQWRRLPNGHVWWNYLKRPSYRVFF